MRRKIDVRQETPTHRATTVSNKNKSKTLRKTSTKTNEKEHQIDAHNDRKKRRKTTPNRARHRMATDLRVSSAKKWPRGDPKTSQERPGATQGRLGSAPKGPESVLGASQERPDTILGVLQDGPERSKDAPERFGSDLESIWNRFGFKMAPQTMIFSAVANVWRCFLATF